MNEIESLEALRRELATGRREGRSIGLVPTMGYLHAGHLRLAEVARSENDLVVLSIFVNPTQFGPNEDFERYPRDLSRDRQLAEVAGVDIVFVPSMATMYPRDQVIWIEPGPLAAHLCGASRPGHFRGVCTVVAKLFNMVGPDRAYFGQKDAQQAMILTRMVADLAFPVEVRVVPTIREPDGLALSSRNVYLSAEDRREAPALRRGLSTAADMIVQGERDPRSIKDAVRRTVARDAPHARVDFVTVADLASLQPVDRSIHQDALIAIAAHFGATRLIDNVIVRFDGGSVQVT